jgi:hypothetical protein
VLPSFCAKSVIGATFEFRKLKIQPERVGLSSDEGDVKFAEAVHGLNFDKWLSPHSARLTIAD